MWTADRVEQLKALLTEGLSAGQIAARLGVSRNAVIGKVDRGGLHLPRMQGKRGPSSKPRRPRKPRPVMLKPTPPARPPQPLVPRNIAAPPSLQIPLLSLTAHACRYPDGAQYDPAKTFCGHPVFEQHVYCESHCRAAYAWPKDRAA